MAEVILILKTIYPSAHCELLFSNPLQLLVATILSAQCTDVRVNLVTPALFQKYPTAHALASASPPEVEALIRSAGFYRTKAKNIIACCRQLVEKHEGSVPSTMAGLIALSGVGRKTANVVLGNAFGLNMGVVVDTHVLRLSIRLGFTRLSDPVKVEQKLIHLVPRDDWTLFSHLLIWHGRRRCKALKPDCLHCELAQLCPSFHRLKQKPPTA